MLQGAAWLLKGLNPVEQEQSSTWRELIAIERTLWSLLKDVSLTVVRLFTDNLAVHYVWLAGSKKKIVQEVVRRMFEFCHERSIQLWIEWIPRRHSVLADALSKCHNIDDWMLNGKYFRILDKLWGRHTFDRLPLQRTSNVSTSTGGSGAQAQLVSTH